MRKVTRDWPQTIAEFKASGLSKRAFCADKGISNASLNYWLNPTRLQNAGTPPANPKFIKLDVLSDLARRVSEARDVELVVELPMGVILRFRGVQR